MTYIDHRQKWKLFSTVLLGLLINTSAISQNYPSRPITIIAPYAAGVTAIFQEETSLQ